MTKRLESDRPCNKKNCSEGQYFDSDKEKWICKAGHIQSSYGLKKVVNK